MTEPTAKPISGPAATVPILETKVRRLTEQNEKLASQIKRANQQLNIFKVRCDHLEHRLREWEDDAAPVLKDADEDADFDD